MANRKTVLVADDSRAVVDVLATAFEAAGWDVVTAADGEEVFRRLAEGVFDEADLIRRAADLAAFVPSAAAAYGFDARSVVALGYSNGANIAAAMLLLHPSVLSSAVLFRSMVPLVPALLPSLPGTPVLLVEGQTDPIVPRANAERLSALLTSAGAAVTLHYEPAGHGLTPNDVKVARSWMAADH